MTIGFGVALHNLGFGLAHVRPEDHRSIVLDAAVQAEELGFDSVWAGDHIALPQNPSKPYPYGQGRDYRIPADIPLLDPIATLAVVAGRTRRVKLGFGVLVLPYRHPLITAKLLATIDVLSNGRLILGAGSGWMPEEFEATGATYEDRDDTTDECVRFLREVWTSGNGLPEVEGELYSLSGMSVLPRPLQKPSIPIWAGGNGRRAMRRAARLCDGWNAVYTDPSALRLLIDQLRDICRECSRDPEELAISVSGVNFDLGPLQHGPRAEGVGADFDKIIKVVSEYESLGVDHIILALPLEEPGQGLGRMQDFAREVLPAFSAMSRLRT